MKKSVATAIIILKYAFIFAQLACLIICSFSLECLPERKTENSL